jgi:hypothetical protein
MINPSLTQSRLKELLHYNQYTGQFTRLTLSGGRLPGSIAGGEKEDGYWRIRVDGKRYSSHRLAWLYMTGAWPDQEIDHIDQNPANNRWVNLRNVSRAVNQQNQRQAQKTNKLGVLGVSFDPKTGKFVARLRINGKTKTLGRFIEIAQASAVHLTAKRKYHEGCTL